MQLFPVASAVVILKNNEMTSFLLSRHALHPGELPINYDTYKVSLIDTQLIGAGLISFLMPLTGDNFPKIDTEVTFNKIIDDAKKQYGSDLIFIYPLGIDVGDRRFVNKTVAPYVSNGVTYVIDYEGINPLVDRLKKLCGTYFTVTADDQYQNISICPKS